MRGDYRNIALQGSYDDYEEEYQDIGSEPILETGGLVSKFDGIICMHFMTDHDRLSYENSVRDLHMMPSEAGPGPIPEEIFRQTLLFRNTNSVLVHEELGRGIWRISEVKGARPRGWVPYVAWAMTQVDDRWRVSAVGQGQKRGDLFVWGRLTPRELSDLSRGKFPPTLAIFGLPGPRLGAPSHSSQRQGRPVDMLTGRGSGRGPMMSSGPRGRPDLDFDLDGLNLDDNDHQFGGRPRGRPGRGAGPRPGGFEEQYDFGAIPSSSRRHHGARNLASGDDIDEPRGLGRRGRDRVPPGGRASRRGRSMPMDDDDDDEEEDDDDDDDEDGEDDMPPPYTEERRSGRRHGGGGARYGAGGGQYGEDGGRHAGGGGRHGGGGQRNFGGGGRHGGGGGRPRRSGL
ncbi:hypothetical protein MMC12_001364 [Toensbergia leucococca]|nr:hypothetical protein [Toensbergia leucococca]